MSSNLIFLYFEKKKGPTYMLGFFFSLSLSARDEISDSAADTVKSTEK